MTIQSVINEVCSFVGVRPPNGSVFVSPYADRTAWEFVQLANEMAQRIACDTRDWTALTNLFLADGDGIKDSFLLPDAFHRLTLTANVRRSDNPKQPLRFESDYDAWVEKFLTGQFSSPGEWIISDNHAIAGKELFVRPVVPLGVQVSVPYIHNLCIRLASGGSGNVFLNDADVFRLSERLLKLGMIWQWKANKGASYAEDLANYEDALSRVAGNDKPSPILVGSRPISSGASIAYWGPTPSSSTFVGPGP